MKHVFLLALTLALLGATSWAQTVPPLTAEDKSLGFVPTLDTLKTAQTLIDVETLWTKPLDWNEKTATTAEIAAHVRQKLGDKIVIEVRGQDASSSTFTLEQAPLGPTLSSIASLGNAKLWAFPGRLLIAPETALTPEENTNIKNKMGGEWKNSSSAGGTGWSARTQFEQISLLLVGADLKQRFTDKGLTPTQRTPPPNQTLDPQSGQIRGTFIHTSRPSLAYELPLGDLAPSTKTIIQTLVDARNQARRDSTPVGTSSAPQPALGDSTIVSFDDTQSNQIYLRLQNKDPQNAQKRIEVDAWYLAKPLTAHR